MMAFFKHVLLLVGHIIRRRIACVPSADDGVVIRARVVVLYGELVVWEKIVFVRCGFIAVEVP